MSQKNNVRLPSSGAGITSFSEEYESRFMISPTGVLVYVAVLVVAVIILRLVA